MKSFFILGAAAGAVLLSTTAMAQEQRQQQGNILEQLLGSVFGTNQQASEQTLETDWNQGRRPFAQRRAALEQRIDTAVRDGSLDRREADQMRREYEEIVRLEAQYSANGNMSQQQRSDLRMRYRALNQRIGGQNNGQPIDQGGYQDNGRWQMLSTRNADFEQRISTGLRNRSLTQAEARRLRSDWRSLAQLEANYRRGGFDAREQADLWSRFNAIDSRLGGSFGHDGNSARWSQLETRLATSERNGRISRNDAVQVRAQLSDLVRLDAAYAMGGYNADERTYLTRRYGELDQMLGNSLR
ncbi:MAG: hypothetical protein ACT6QT_15475 [Sphingopyxis sp.]|jgi:uncharacterized protein YdbL (DUF1318 family)|uniref:hypothetical protein n=1 Tax=Sphingopyxis sp. TaxID=1908224 RepID=UPI001AC36110|nr:hypothetical protein [Sphingomonadales bacterium]